MQSMYFMTDMIFLQREKIMKGWENQKNVYEYLICVICPLEK